MYEKTYNLCYLKLEIIWHLDVLIFPMVENVSYNVQIKLFTPAMYGSYGEGGLDSGKSK